MMSVREADIPLTRGWPAKH